MGKIYLIRHGQVEKRYDGSYYGITDVRLSKDGDAQGNRVINHLKGRDIVRIFTSPLFRARSLAEKASKKLGAKLKVVQDFHEMDFGKWEGLTYDQIRERFPRKTKSFLSHPHRVRLGGGENIADLCARVTPAFRKIALTHQKENIAIVAHGGPIKAILCDILKAPKRSIFRISLKYASISVLENWGNEFSLDLLNYTDHLGDLLRH